MTPSPRFRNLVGRSLLNNSNPSRLTALSSTSHVSQLSCNIRAPTLLKLLPDTRDVRSSSFPNSDRTLLDSIKGMGILSTGTRFNEARQPARCFLNNPRPVSMSLFHRFLTEWLNCTLARFCAVFCRDFKKVRLIRNIDLDLNNYNKTSDFLRKDTVFLVIVK